jgi:TRAP-type mannitol/chloroaromatic compound transport system substrate-binding protein
VKPGDRIGVYKLIEKIGRGNYQVWKAEKESPLRRTQAYALKFIPEDEVDEKVLAEEVQLWDQASEKHNDYIARFIDAEKYNDGEHPYLVIVSEYAPEGSLQALIARRQQENRPFTSAEIKKIITGILRGLEHLHSREPKIIHRDLKPANVVFKDGVPKIIDFGISRIFTSESIKSHLPKGTPCYMAPEAFLGTKNPPVDIWAVGVILYQMLTGELPFPIDPSTARDFYAVQRSVTSDPYRPLPENTPEKYRQIIDKALDKIPVNRYSSVVEMREAVEALPPLPYDPATTEPEVDPIPGGQSVLTRPVDKPQPPAPPPAAVVTPPDPQGPTPRPLFPTFERRHAFIVLAGLLAVAAVLMFALKKPDFIFKSSGATSPTPGQPIKLKLATYWRSDLPILADNVKEMAKDITDSSNGELQIEVLFAGEAKDAGGNPIAPSGLFDAVSNNKVQMVHSASYYWEDRIKGASFFSSVPFGMNSEQMETWIKEKDGLTLWRELYKPYKVMPFPCGHTGEQMGGWFDKEILTIHDFEGIVMRIPGLGGKVLNKAGAKTKSIPPQDIVKAKDAGEINAAEWIGPYHDCLLGLQDKWTYYYGPGWQERDTMFELLINQDVYNSLPERLQNLIRMKSEEYDRKIARQFVVRNAEYEDVLRKKLVNFRTFPRAVLATLKTYRDEVLQDYNAGDTQKIYQSYMDFLQQTSRRSSRP